MHVWSFYVYIHVHRCSSAFLVTSSVAFDIVFFAMAKNITIVTGGVQDKDWFRKEMEKVYHDDFDVIDLREILVKDPGVSVGHKQDFEYERTQVVVVSQDGFPDLIKSVIDTANFNMAHFFMHCKTGWHRASVTGKMLESQLNSLVDADGNRLFNTICFTLHDCQTAKEYSTKLSNVVDWLDNPWVIESEYNGLKDSLFGYRMCMSTGPSARNWNNMYDIIGADYARIGKKKVTFTPSVHTSASAPLFTMPPPPSMPLPVRPPPRPPPPVLNSTAKAGPSSAKPPRPPEPPSQAAFEQHHARQQKQRDQHWQQEEQLPAWATLERNVKVWWSIFDHWAIDVYARECLFALAQHSDEGYKAANDLVGKLLKKKNDNSTFNNASAFLFSSVLNARHNINPDVEGDRASKRVRY
jgi:hypothetical protein